VSYATEQEVLNAQWNAAYAAQQADEARMRPSVLYRPALMRDGNAWCALYGENIQIGCCGYGASPEDAMVDFDAKWNEK
jgi:hypothetical protein